MVSDHHRASVTGFLLVFVRVFVFLHPHILFSTLKQQGLLLDFENNGHWNRRPATVFVSSSVSSVGFHSLPTILSIFHFSTITLVVGIELVITTLVESVIILHLVLRRNG